MSTDEGLEGRAVASAGPDAAEFDSDQRYFGKYRGLVVSVADPWKQGRIRAKVPEILGDEPLGWALPCVPYAGDGVGLFAIPPVDSGVWIEFEAGELERPVWVGSWWGQGQVPTDDRRSRATPRQKVLRSEEGLHVQLDDDSGAITISDSTGRNKFTISTRDGELKVESTLKVVVDAPTIELVDKSLNPLAMHPLVFGDLLLTYLNSLVLLFNEHQHVGETLLGVVPITPAKPVPLFTPATPILHSQRVTTG